MTIQNNPTNPQSGFFEKFDDILARVLGGVNAARTPGGTVTISNPQADTVSVQPNYMPLLVIALVVVIVVVASR